MIGTPNDPQLSSDTKAIAKRARDRALQVKVALPTGNDARSNIRSAARSPANPARGWNTPSLAPAEHLPIRHQPPRAEAMPRSTLPQDVERGGIFERHANI
jgi:hypothetical protein